MPFIAWTSKSTLSLSFPYPFILSLSTYKRRKEQREVSLLIYLNLASETAAKSMESNIYQEVILLICCRVSTTVSQGCWAPLPLEATWMRNRRISAAPYRRLKMKNRLFFLSLNRPRQLSNRVSKKMKITR